eukprot:scaffold842_cov357-Prasinococcus_capsulatus_cf.AAC.6
MLKRCTFLTLGTTSPRGVAIATPTLWARCNSSSSSPGASVAFACGKCSSVCESIFTRKGSIVYRVSCRPPLVNISTRAITTRTDCRKQRALGRGCGEPGTR